MASSITPYTRKLSRKSHRKTRSGCKNCKRRRIKCDETKPQCSNCIRHAIDCDFSSQSEDPSGSSAEGSPTGPSPSDKLDGSYTYIPSTSSNFKPPKRGHGPSSTTLPPPPRDQPPQELAHRPFQFTATDMALFHHLLTSKELTGWSPRAQQELCRLGFAHHYVLRLLLAFAGFHIAQTPGDLSNSPYMGMHTDFHTEADRHLDLAMREISTLVTQIHPNNSAALYTSAIFIFLCSLAKGPQPGEYLAFRDDRSPGHLALFLGVRSIFERCQNDMHPSVFAIHGGEEEEEKETPNPDPNTQPPLEDSPQATHYADHLAAFRELLSSLIPTTDPRAPSYQQSLDQLHFSLHAVLESQDPGVPLFPLIFAWLYQLPDAVVHDLQCRQPPALILFAFFTLLLNKLTAVWFIRPWPRHIMYGIHYSLDPCYRPYIQWLIDQVGISPGQLYLNINQS
ncbi:C6 transcription factor [Aspergillus sclerotiicarbonarius CBS 121057]|uniref:C6 transcription factor n=1 Tax=Aspergillus sclerotiicarbonarius (strain CBS 121057 / IBT 28362) TaxID=1448318 RepID=A0A319DVV0_ASPSB|nr:C6 transcription factor [Aspergillus sclerotiicarbonarius CBS 121057]